MRIVAVIPAKGQSERVPGKNMKQLSDKPLIHYTAQIMLDCDLVDEVVVSSEAAVILEYAESLGCSVDYRPKHLATNDVMCWDIVRRIAADYTVRRNQVDLFLEVHCTYPFRKMATVNRAICVMLNSAADGCLVGQAFTDRVWRVDSRRAIRLAKDIPIENSQTMKPLFRDCYGLVNVYRPNLILSGNPYNGRLMIVPTTDRIESHDIDTECDFWIADLLMRRGVTSYE